MWMTSIDGLAGEEEELAKISWASQQNLHSLRRFQTAQRFWKTKENKQTNKQNKKRTTTKTSEYSELPPVRFTSTLTDTHAHAIWETAKRHVTCDLVQSQSRAFVTIVDGQATKAFSTAAFTYPSLEHEHKNLQSIDFFFLYWAQLMARVSVANRYFTLLVMKYKEAPLRPCPL